MNSDRVLLCLLLLVLLLSSIPSFFGFASAPAGSLWTGILTHNSADVNGYLGIIEEIRQGHWRARNLFTAEPHPPFQIRPYFTAIGVLGRLFPAVSNVALLEIGRLVSATGFLLILLLLTRFLFHNSVGRASLPANTSTNDQRARGPALQSFSARDRAIAFVIVTLGSGFGWLHLDKKVLDLGLVETSTFLTLTAPPLYTVSLSLIIGILFSVERILATQRMRWSVIAGILALWLGLDRPFSLLTVGIAVSVTWIGRGASETRPVTESTRAALRPASTKLFPFLFGAAIPIIYQMYCVSKIPVYAEWNRQHVLPTPNTAALLSAFGLLLPGAMLGVKPFVASHPRLATIVAVYAIASMVLIHLPFPYQVRFLEGLPLCLALFTAFGVISLVQKIRRPVIGTLIACAVTTLLIPSSFAAVARNLEAIALQAPPHYMPERAIAAMRQLSILAGENEAILSSEPIGNFIVGHAGRPVVLGHRIATARYVEKRQLVLQFFHADARDPKSEKLFDQMEATWLYWGPEEIWISQGKFHPKSAPYLEPRYSNGLVTLYKKRSQAPSS